jgi:hypothetical protein
MGLPLWMGDAPDYEIVNGHMQISMGEFVLAMPINVFLVGCAKGRAAIIQWEQRKPAGEVVKFPGFAGS